MGEVAAVCDRILIINKGKIVADEKTENITRVVENNRRMNIKVCGPSKEVLNTLKEVPGVCFAEMQTERDGDAYVFTVESEPGADVRKKIFFTMAQNGWAIVGLEAVGMSLEDIFISVVDRAEKEKATSHRYERSTKKRIQRSRNMLEEELAGEMVKEAEAKREEDAKTQIDD